MLNDRIKARMKIGIPKEIKGNENRVALVPSGASALVAAGQLSFW